MATLITKTVKPAGGGDYTTLQAAVNATPASLVTADEQWDIVCYDGGNLGSTTCPTRTTDATRYLRIVAHQSVRHRGVYSTSYAYISGDYQPLAAIPHYTRVEGLQISVTGDDLSMKGIVALYGTKGIYIEGNIIRAVPNGSPVYWSVQCWAVDLGTDLAGDCFVFNNIFYGWNVKTTGNAGLSVQQHTSGKTYCYNNTFVDCYTGILDGYNKVVVKNCLFAGSNAVLSGGVDSASDYNASDLGTTTGGANDRVSQTFTFVNAGAKDYHLAAGDAGARTYGVDLSGDANLPFNTDIDGTTRVPWDIGADEYIDPRPRRLTLQWRGV